MAGLRSLVTSIRAALAPAPSGVRHVLHRSPGHFYPHRYALWLLAPALLTLTACAPDPVYITRPVYIDRVQQVVQPIDPELLQLHPIAEGPPSQCLSVAAQRRAELEKCNADKAAIAGIAGAKERGDE